MSYRDLCLTGVGATNCLERTVYSVKSAGKPILNLMKNIMNARMRASLFRRDLLFFAAKRIPEGEKYYLIKA